MKTYLSTSIVVSINIIIIIIIQDSAYSQHWEIYLREKHFSIVKICFSVAVIDDTHLQHL